MGLGAQGGSAAAAACQQACDFSIKYQTRWKPSARRNASAARGLPRRMKLIGFGVRLLSFLLETFPGPSGRRCLPDSRAALLAQTLISPGVPFIMTNAEMMKKRLSRQRRASLTPPRGRIDHCHPGPACSGAHGGLPGRLPRAGGPSVAGFLPNAFIHLLLNICLATRVPIYFQLR